MLNFIFILVFTLTSAVDINNNSTDFKEYEVIKAIPKTQAQIQTLKNILISSEYDVWSYSKELGSSWVFMLKPSQVKKIKMILTLNDIMYQHLNSNVAKILHMLKSTNKLELEKETIALSKQARNKRDTDHGYGLARNRYHSYAKMRNYMGYIADKHPNKVKILNIGTTYEGRPIQGVKIATPGQKKIGILIDAGIHAREWLAPATALHIIAQLAENPKYKYMVENVAWYIFPCINPDGYSFSRSTKPMWRKTRTPGQKCYGVDANRNFDFHWGDAGSTSTNECSVVYIGPRPFSEPESASISKFATTHINQLKLYVSLHSFGDTIMYPWAYSSSSISNKKELHDLGQQVADAIADIRGKKYAVGQVTELLYKASGSSMDWMANLGIPLTYTIELPGLDFAAPVSQIRPTGNEIFLAMKMMHEYVEIKYGNNSNIK